MLFKRFRNRSLSSIVGLLHLVVSTMMVMPASLNAQGVDPDPPVIQHERIAEGFIGDSQVFSATVTDDIGLESVVLNYRFDSSAPYQTAEMNALGSTDIHTVSIETQGTDATLIEYYIEARDESGNRSIRGFAFDPLERQLVRGAGQAPPPVATSPVEAPPPAAGISTGRKVLYGVLGLVVVGALAAAASGSGSDGGSDNDNVPVVITIPPPQTR